MEFSLEVPMKNLKLKIALLEKDVSQCQLSQELGCDPAVVSRIVNGWKEPGADMKDRISRVLEIPAAELFSDSLAPQ